MEFLGDDAKVCASAQFLNALPRPDDIYEQIGTSREHMSSLITSTHLTAHFGLESVFHDILESDTSSIGARDSAGRTALCWAADMNNETVVRTLLRKGADPNFKDNNGRTPLSWAAGLTVAHNSAKLLLEWGADPDSKDIDDHTPLLWAAKHALMMAWPSDYESKKKAEADQSTDEKCRERLFKSTG